MFAAMFLLSLHFCQVSAQEASRSAYDSAIVGPRRDGRIVVPTNQVLSPLGRQIDFPGRPNDLALSPDGRWLAILNRYEVLMVDTASLAVVAEHKISGASYTGIVFSPSGKELFVSTVPKKRSLQQGGIVRLAVAPNGSLSPGKPELLAEERLPLGSPVRDNDQSTVFGAKVLPAGLAISPDGARLYAAMNLTNELIEIELATGRRTRTVPVGNAPFDVCIAGARAFVSNFGGRRPTAGETIGPAGIGSPVKVDPRRHIASDGSVSVVDLSKGKVVAEIVVGLHPSGLDVSPDGRYVVVANANSDTVSVLSTDSLAVVETVSARLDKSLLFGSAPNDVLFGAAGRRLFVSNGTNNAVAAIAFDPPRSKLLGALPTGWYPAGLALDRTGQTLFVANIKGVGSRDAGWKGTRKVKGNVVFGYNSHDYRGSVSVVPVPDDAAIAAHSKTVLENNRHTEIISAMAPPRRDVAPRAVPQRHGEPSLFKHIVYIIKENRTYDQVFGDVAEGNGDASLCIFGEQVTPNHHKIAREFVLLDNFYCSGTLSADGHHWATEAYVTDYIEKAFGGFPRSYPYDGGDALAYASSGFLWDNALAHKRTLRVYGEFVDATIRWRDRRRKDSPKFLDCYKDFINQSNQIEIRARATIKTLEPYICESYIGFPGIVPDVYRADQFIRELKAFEQKGSFPNLAIMLLPNDHTEGTNPGYPTPEAAVADNDLAFGRIVEAISHSIFWKDTCIFVVQDDPQNGYDHIDGHRTVAFVISPYTRRRCVDSTNYNQTSMVRTIELILGLPPMNQLDASATPMTSCFTGVADLAPYKATPNRIPLDRLNPLLADITDPRQLHWAKKSLELPMDRIDEADEDTLNRILWFAARGRDDNYPDWAVLADD